MSSLPQSSISPTSSFEREATTRRLCDLLDILVAIRIDVGDGANGIAASPALGPAEMREVRVLVDRAIASAKYLLGTVECPRPTQESGLARGIPRAANHT
jgi:hypothetical protein